MDLRNGDSIAIVSLVFSGGHGVVHEVYGFDSFGEFSLIQEYSDAFDRVQIALDALFSDKLANGANGIVFKPQDLDRFGNPVRGAVLGEFQVLTPCQVAACKFMLDPPANFLRA